MVTTLLRHNHRETHKFGCNTMINRESESDGLRIQRLEKRKLKFSKDSRDSILNDPLRDKALLSRSINTNIESLLTSQSNREKFLESLKTEGTTSLGHGLRKLREVVISIYDKNSKEESFVRLVFEVYEMSYNFYLKEKDFNKLGCLILNFMVTKLPLALVKEYAEVYVISLSHLQHDMDKCLLFLRNTWQDTELTSISRQLLDLSLIYSCQTGSPCDWFKIVSTFPTGSLIYEYLTRCPAFNEMEQRTWKLIKKCYNQIPSKFLVDGWFQGMIDMAELQKRYDIVFSSKENKIVLFKGRK